MAEDRRGKLELADKEKKSDSVTAPDILAPAPAAPPAYSPPSSAALGTGEPYEGAARSKKTSPEGFSAFQAAPKPRKLLQKDERPADYDAHVSKERQAGATSAPVPSPLPSVPSGDHRGGLIPVRVTVIDSAGRPVAWLRFEASDALRKRYEFLRDEEPEPKQALSERSDQLRSSLLEPRGRAGQGYHVVVRVVKSGDLYDLAASLFDLEAQRETKRAEALAVPDDQLSAKINSIVTSVLQDR
ncbi:MAG: hypothetical protein FJY85_03035 [Deltaproteobacteria bacterium]|nr:hypothetical protein [Deltaproteobacteria bacterium]